MREIWGVMKLSHILIVMLVTWLHFAKIQNSLILLPNFLNLALKYLFSLKFFRNKEAFASSTHIFIQQ